MRASRCASRRASRQQAAAAAGGDDDATDSAGYDCDTDAEAETTNGSLASVGCAYGSSKRKLPGKEKQRAKKDAKKEQQRTKKHQDAADAGFVPIARRNPQFDSLSVGVGDKRSCLPDATVIAMKEKKIDVSVADAYEAMPFTHKHPTVRQANDFLHKFDRKLQSQSDLCLNPLELFKRADGTYLLQTELTVDGKIEKRFAVYCFKHEWKKYSKHGVGVIVGNSDNDYVGIEDKDRADNEAAIRAFQGKWDDCRLVNAYELVRL